MKIIYKYRTYFKFTNSPEDSYELVMPVPTLNNLIIGTTYLDISENMTVVN